MVTYLIVAGAGTLLLALVLMLAYFRDDTRAPAKSVSSIEPKERAAPEAVERAVVDNIAGLAEAQFPDNPGLTWNIHGFEHARDLTYVELEPQPSEVGYERFKLAFTQTLPPVHVATYCLEAGRYNLLATSQGAPRLERQLPSRL